MIWNTRELAAILEECDNVQCIGARVIRKYAPELLDRMWEEALDWKAGLLALELLEESVRFGKHFKVFVEYRGGMFWVGKYGFVEGGKNGGK